MVCCTVPKLEERLTEPFRELLSGPYLNSLEVSNDVTLVVDRDLRIRYLNPAWFRANEASGAPTDYGVGSLFLTAIRGRRRKFYAEHSRQVFDTGQVWSVEYACPCADAFRLFRLTIYPVGDCEGLAMRHLLTSERRHDGRVSPHGDPSIYRSTNGIATQCAQCKRFRAVHDPIRWDWISEWAITTPENVSHGYCPSCLSGPFFGQEMTSP